MGESTEEGRVWDGSGAPFYPGVNGTSEKNRREDISQNQGVQECRKHRESTEVCLQDNCKGGSKRSTCMTSKPGFLGLVSNGLVVRGDRRVSFE